MFNYENIESLNDLELSLYNYIIKIKDRVVDMTIREVASEAHVSTTTVLRLCKKLGFDGFSEFKIKLKLNFEEERLSKVSDETSELINFLQCVENSKLDKKVEELSEMMKKAENIIFIGNGTSGVLSQYAARFLSSLGKFAVYMDDPYFPMNLKYYENSMVIALSVSGETRIIIEFINKLRSEGCKIASITNTEDCTIAKISDINLAYYIKESKVGNNNITSQLPVIYIVERLGKKVMDKKIIL